MNNKAKVLIAIVVVIKVLLNLALLVGILVLHSLVFSFL